MLDLTEAKTAIALWNAKLLTEIESLRAELKKAADALKKIVEVSGTSTLHYHVAHEALRSIDESGLLK